MTAAIQLVASGDSRLAANRSGWAAQAELESRVQRAFERLGRRVVRVHPFDDAAGHGFIDSQARGIRVFRGVDPALPIVVATSIWQYSSHVLPGLTKHRAPILTLANWSGQWPGLVGMLNLNGSLTKGRIRYSTVWSSDFTDSFATQALGSWAQTGRVEHDLSHVRPLGSEPWPQGLEEAVRQGRDLGEALLREQALIGVFDEGCMGMYNAIVPDRLLHSLGIFKERLSQSALFARMLTISDASARGHLRWLGDRGMRFNYGPDPARHLTEAQVIEGLKMYEAAVELAVENGCDAIGIQYQHGLQGLCVASDLAEGLLNEPDRPPVMGADGQPILPGLAIPHFNEVDECAGIDALLTNRVWRRLGLNPATTLHDVRWGADVRERGVAEFVWVFEISGAVPPSHLDGGYGGAVGERQPAMYFPRGGSTIRGASRPGEIVWSRIYVENDALSMDIGRGCAVRLSPEENERRWQATTREWPIMNAILYGVSRDQFMAQHKANHVQVAYAPSPPRALEALVAKAEMAQALGMRVNLCGELVDALERHQSSGEIAGAGTAT